jgi:diguanylate cyclase (GGDEF)-like protein/PAS domain S-box-containing protein
VEPLNMTTKKQMKCAEVSHGLTQVSACASVQWEGEEKNLPTFLKKLDFLSGVSSIGFMVTGLDGTIISFSKTVEELLGIGADAYRNTNVSDIYADPNDRKRLLGMLDAANTVRDFEVNLKRKDGALLTALANVDCVELDTGRILLTSIYDITQYIHKRQQAERLLQKANRGMVSWLKKLQERTRDMNELNELGKHLQGCQTIAEACAISVRYIKRICPQSRGALYLIDEADHCAKAAITWGEPHALTAFTPENCRAIQDGYEHLVDENHPGPLCGHITGPASDQYLCLPLVVNAETIGILHLSQPDGSGRDRQETGSLEYKAQIIVSIASHISISLSNIKLRETLLQQSIRDVLTGLFNRRYMEETLVRELSRAEREHKPVGLIMFDIDHFKQLNDTAGHHSGDALLRALGAYLNRVTRGGDIVCRYGGDEFLAVLPGAGRENARQFAEKIRQGIKELQVGQLESPSVRCTISLGVAVYPEDGSTSETLLKAADNALYRAKNEGKDRTVLA